MRIPQDVANPLAVAIRDVLWYKPKVLAFFKDCELPRQLLAEVKEQQSTGTATIKIVHFVLDELDKYGDAGWVVAKRILTKMNYDERVILFDGSDLRCVLDCQIAFDVLLAEKQMELVKNKRPWVSAFAIINRRTNQ
jgi:hypothetical protein